MPHFRKDVKNIFGRKIMMRLCHLWIWDNLETVNWRLNFILFNSLEHEICAEIGIFVNHILIKNALSKLLTIVCCLLEKEIKFLPMSNSSIVEYLNSFVETSFFWHPLILFLSSWHCVFIFSKIFSSLLMLGEAGFCGSRNLPLNRYFSLRKTPIKMLVIKPFHKPRYLPLISTSNSEDLLIRF